MKKKILVPIVVAVLLAIPNFGHSGVTKSERAKFNRSIRNIEARNSNYKKRKSALWKSEQRLRRERVKKVNTKKKNEEILRKNRESARKYMEKNNQERRRNAKVGQLYLDEITGNFIRK